jgi:hypothetical protein
LFAFLTGWLDLPKTPVAMSPSPRYGNQRAWLRNSSSVQIVQTNNSPSITFPIGRCDGISRSPGDSCCWIESAKRPGIVLMSRETSTRPASAATRRTSGSGAPSGMTPERHENRWRVHGAVSLCQWQDSNRRPPESEGSRLLNRELTPRALEALSHPGRQRIARFELFPSSALLLHVRVDLVRMF